MRYGVVRVSPDLPPPHVQRRRIETSGCDIVLEARSSSPSSERVLRQLLFGLKGGDEVVVHSLEAFEASVDVLVRLLRHFHEAAVTLRLVGGEKVETLAPNGPAPRVLSLLADYATRHPVRPPTRRRARASTAPLTPHQIRFAREMHRRGQSMRAIGLLFQQSPNEIAAILGRDPARDHPDDEVAHPSADGSA